MYIGLGIVLLVIGLVFTMDVLTIDVRFVDDHALGWILIIGGVLAIVLSLVVAPPWRRTRETDVHPPLG